MSYHFSGLGAAAPWVSPLTADWIKSLYKSPVWVRESRTFDIDARGVGSRCFSNKTVASAGKNATWGCPCPDGYRLVKYANMPGGGAMFRGTRVFPFPQQPVDSALHWSDKQRQEEAKRIRGVSVKNTFTGKMQDIPEIFSCVPQKLPCELDQVKYQATMLPFDVHIEVIETRAPGGVVTRTPGRVVAVPGTPITGDVCFDKDRRPGKKEDETKQKEQEEQRKEYNTDVACNNALQMIKMCRDEKTPTSVKTSPVCLKVSDDEGLIRLNCGYLPEELETETEKKDKKSGKKKKAAGPAYYEPAEVNYVPALAIGAAGVLGIGVLWLLLRKKR